MIRFILAFSLFALPLQGEFLFDGPNLYYRTLKTAEEEFETAKDAWKKGDFASALVSFEAITQHHPRSPFATESIFRAAQCLYRLNELESANEKISLYLKSQGAPAYFKEAAFLKFQIAEKFRLGAGKPIFGVRYLPKWLGGELLALELYDEISTILPSDPIAAKSLYSKGLLLKEIGQWKEGIDALQHLIRRFPRDSLAPDAYVLASEVLRSQGELEAQNPDILSLARLNAKRFETDFPYDERVADVKKSVRELEEAYAQALFETGMLYERIGEPTSAEIYYKNADYLFPDTKVAHLSALRLKRLEKEHLAMTQGEDQGEHTAK